MPRTVQELDAATRAMDKPQPQPELPIVITAEEADVIIADHRAARLRRGKQIPDRSYLMQKILSGKANINGHAIKVEN